MAARNQLLRRSSSGGGRSGGGRSSGGRSVARHRPANASRAGPMRSDGQSPLPRIEQATRLLARDAGLREVLREGRKEGTAVAQCFCELRSLRRPPLPILSV